MTVPAPYLHTITWADEVHGVPEAHAAIFSYWSGGYNNGVPYHEAYRFDVVARTPSSDEITIFHKILQRNPETDRIEAHTIHRAAYKGIPDALLPQLFTFPDQQRLMLWTYKSLRGGSTMRAHFTSLSRDGESRNHEVVGTLYDSLPGRQLMSTRVDFDAMTGKLCLVNGRNVIIKDFGI